MEWMGDMVLQYVAKFVSHQCIPGPCSPTKHVPHPQYGGHAVYLDQLVHRTDVRITDTEYIPLYHRRYSWGEAQLMPLIYQLFLIEQQSPVYSGKLHNLDMDKLRSLHNIVSVFMNQLHFVFPWQLLYLFHLLMCL